MRGLRRKRAACARTAAQAQGCDSQWVPVQQPAVRADVLSGQPHAGGGGACREVRVLPCAPDVALETAVRVCRHLSQSHDGPTGGAAGSMEPRVVCTEATEACLRCRVSRSCYGPSVSRGSAAPRRPIVHECVDRGDAQYATLGASAASERAVSDTKGGERMCVILTPRSGPYITG